jgi:anti-sigma regulatory factor (Ser/Thr protein kinase)
VSACQAEPLAAARPRRHWPLDSVTPLMAALPTVPAMARAFVRTTLGEWQLESLAESAELVISELASNAVAASTGDSGRPQYVNGHMPCVRVCLLSDGTRVVLEVWDQAPGVPVIREVTEYEENGRGLMLVDAIANRWGCWCPAVGPGKVVWAEMSA